MNAIIGMGDYENCGCLSKDSQVLYNQPLIKYILDELYSYQEYIDNIIVVTSNKNYFTSIINLVEKDKLFLNKIHIIEDLSKSLLSNIVIGHTYIKDNNLVSDSILFWSGTELAFQTRKFSDPSLNSFRCAFLENKDKYENINENARIIFDPKTNTFKLVELNEITFDKELLISDSTIDELEDLSTEDDVLGKYGFKDLGEYSPLELVNTYNGEFINIFKFDYTCLDNILKNNEFYSLEEFITFYFETDSDNTTVSEIGFLFSLNKIESENFFKQYVNLKNSISNDGILIDIDFLNDSITKTNKYSLLGYSTEILDKLKSVRTKLFNESDIISRYNEKQKVYSPNILDIGITKAGDYVDEITEEFIPGPTLDKVLLYGKLSDSQISNCVSKVLHIIENVFHTNSDYTAYDLAIRRVDSKHINSYIERKKEYYKSIASYYKEIYSLSNINEYGFVFDYNIMSKWNLFIDNVFSEYLKDCSDSNIFYQGLCERFVHGNLLFSSIIYNQDYNKVHFINQNLRYYSICDFNEDYIDLLVSTYMNLHALLDGLYYEDNSIIEIPSKVIDTTSKYLASIGEKVSNIEKLKLLSIIKLFTYPYENCYISNNTKRIIINYSSQVMESIMTF